MNKLKQINIVLLLLVLYSLRILYFGASYEDAPVLGIIALVHFGLEYIKIRKEVITENVFRTQVNQDIASIKSTLSAVSMQKNGNPFGGRK